MEPVQAAPLRANYSGVHAEGTRVFHQLGLLRSQLPLVRTQYLKPGVGLASLGAAGSSSAATVKPQATAPISFTFTGFSSADQDVLSNFLRLNYANFVDVFGDPSPSQQGKTVTIVGNGGFANAYSPPSESSTNGGTIYYQYRDDIEPGLRADFNRYNLARLVLAAFHGRRNFAFNYNEGLYIDAWERGFADAAALLVAYKAQGSPSNFDPSLLGSYVLPIYDLLNRPDLGNAYFFPISGDDLVVGAFRVSMAQAAWLKVAVENPSFFKNFHEKYYAAWTPELAANVDGLVQMAASVTGSVEGKSFADWYRRQHVLNTSVSTGQKLYLATLPLPNATSGDLRSGFQGYAQWYNTAPDGGESALSGLGSVAAFDEAGKDISTASTELRRSNVVQFGATPSLPGQALLGAGFSAIGTPDQARITVRVKAGTCTATGLFPYNVAGNTGTTPRYYGVLTSGSSGTLNLTQAARTGSATVSRGAWTSSLAYVSGPQVKTVLRLGTTQTVRNTAWLVPGSGARSVAFVVDGQGGSSSVTLTAAAGASPLRMITVPIFPTASDEAEVLGLPAASLELARYKPNLSPSTFQDGALNFGVGADKHELYPRISEPMAPGRGYWLKVATPYQKVVNGTLPATNTPYSVPLMAGWNQVGNPFTAPFPVANLKVGYGDFQPVPFQEAIARNWISPGIWRWRPAGGYERVDVTGGALPVFEGCYIYTPLARGAYLSFAPSTAAGAAAATASNGWSLRLSATASGVTDKDSTFGVLTGRVAAAKPPAADRVVSGRFATSGDTQTDGLGAGAAAGWADSFLTAVARYGSWEYVVDGLQKGQKVTLSWPVPQGLPDYSKLQLIDLANGTVTGMRLAQNYGFTAAGPTRKFRIQLARWAHPTLTVSTNSSGNATISVQSNIAFSGKLVLRQNGVILRTLAATEFPAGKSTWAWDRKNDAGQLLPKGWYNASLFPDSADDDSASFNFQIK